MTRSLKSQSVLASIYTYIGVLIGFAVTIFVQPFYLTESQIGLLRIITSYATLLLPFCTLGFYSAALRYFPYFRTKDNTHNGFLFLFLIVNTIGCILASIVLFYSKSFLVKPSDSQVFQEYLIGIFLLFISFSFFGLFDTYARLLYDSIIGRFLKELFTRILVLSAFCLFIIFKLSFYQFFWVWLFANIVPTFLLIFRLYSKNQLNFTPNLGFLNKSLRGKLISISLFAILTSSSTVIIQHIDGVMIARYLSLAENGVFGICMYFGVVISMPTRAVYSALATQLGEDWKSNNLENIYTMYKTSCLFLGAIALIIFSLIWLNVDSLFVFLPDVYKTGKWVIFFMGIGALLEMATGINGVIISTSRFYKYDTYFLLVLILITIALNLILIPHFKIVGVAIAYASTFGIYNVCRVLFVYNRFKFNPFDREWLFTMLYIFLAFGLCLLIPSISPYLTKYPLEDIIVRSGFFLGLILVIIFYIKPSLQIELITKKYINELLLKLGK